MQTAEGGWPSSRISRKENLNYLNSGKHEKQNSLELPNIYACFSTERFLIECTGYA